jgi:hypothetical protein
MDSAGTATEGPYRMIVPYIDARLPEPDLIRVGPIGLARYNRRELWDTIVMAR